MRMNDKVWMNDDLEEIGFLFYCKLNRHRKIEGCIFEAVTLFREGNYIRTLGALYQCLEILNSSNGVRWQYSIVYRYLSICYLELHKRKLALKYIDLHIAKNSDPVVLKVCHEYRKSILNVSEGMARARPVMDPSCSKEGILLMSMAIELTNDPSAYFHFNLSVFYCASGQHTDGAIHLTKAIEGGFNKWHSIFDEGYLNEIVDTEEFERLFKEYYQYEEPASNNDT